MPSLSETFEPGTFAGGLAGGTVAVGNACAIPLPDCSAHLIVTSPPYGLNKYYKGKWVPDDDPDSWSEMILVSLIDMFRIAAPSGRLALNIPLDTTKGGMRPVYADAVNLAIGAGWTYRSTIVWNDGQISKSIARGSIDSPSSPHIIARAEMVALFSKGSWKRQKPPAQLFNNLTHQEWLDWTSGVWSLPPETRPWEKHPAAFPYDLPYRLIKILSFPGDLVCDPYLGSGTTVVAARDLGRRYAGFDMSQEYVQSSIRRLQYNGKQ